MSTLPTQVLSQVLITNLAPWIASSVSALASSYFTPSRETVIRTVQEVDDEREVDLLQIDRMLKWMRLVFDATPSRIPEGESATHSQYKQELYSIYMTICSDYKEYQRWKTYNSSLWLFSGYRKKNTKHLARKILADVRLFHEGLQMFSMMRQVADRI
jgi:hypothetical protein